MVSAKAILDTIETKTNSDSLYEAILADKALLLELHKAGLNDQDIRRYLPILSEYQKSKNNCQKCKGLDFCKNPTPGYRYSLSFEDGPSLQISRCKYLTDADNCARNYLYRDFDEKWLETYSGSDKKSDKAKNILDQFREAHRDENRRWVYLYGEPGAGKSYWCSYVTTSLAKQGKTVAFINCNRRFDELKGISTTNKSSFLKKMKELQECDVLVLDDFGSEYKSEYVRDQIVLPILNERSKNKRTTYLLSDYSLSQIGKLYNFSFSPSAGIVAEQLVNLIKRNIKSTKQISAGFESEVF